MDRAYSRRDTEPLRYEGEGSSSAAGEAKMFLKMLGPGRETPDSIRHLIGDHTHYRRRVRAIFDYLRISERLDPDEIAERLCVPESAVLHVFKIPELCRIHTQAPTRASLRAHGPRGNIRNGVFQSTTSVRRKA